MNNCGTMRHKIKIQRPDAAKDSGGGKTTNWVDVTVNEIWAEVKEVNRTEYRNGQQEQVITTHEVKIRYRAGVADNMRVLYQGSRALNIKTIKNIEDRNEFLLLKCVEE